MRSDTLQEDVDFLFIAQQNSCFFWEMICWPTNPCVKNSLFIFIACWLHWFLPVHWDQTMIIVCQSLGGRPILVLELFTLVLCPFGTTSHCLSVQPVLLLPSRNIWRHISLIWPVPHRYHHSPSPVDVTELFPRFCCWTLIWLLHHRVWLRRGYWRYRSVTDWLIDVYWTMQTISLLDFFRESHCVSGMRITLQRALR